VVAGGIVEETGVKELLGGSMCITEEALKY